MMAILNYISYAIVNTNSNSKAFKSTFSKKDSLSFRGAANPRLILAA
jgi:hypothetical protein